MCCGSLVSIRLLIFLSKWFYAFLKTAILQVFRVQINPYFTIPREKKGLYFYFIRPVLAATETSKNSFLKIW